MAISHIPKHVGHNFTPEYQISAIPYNKTSADSSQIVVVTATGKIVPGGVAGGANIAIQSLAFPKITQWIRFKAVSAINIYFSRKDAAAENTNCIKLLAGEITPPLNLRCTSLYFINGRANNLQITTGLTIIQAEEFTNVVEAFLGDDIT